MKNSLYILFLLISFQAFPQAEIDSILKKALDELYEHPQKAIEIGQNVVHSDKATQQQKVNALLVISTAYSSQRNYAKSLDYAVQAASQIPKSDDDSFKINAYSRLGLQYQQLKIYNKAHSYLDKAIAIVNSSKQKFDRDKLLGFNYAIRGMIYKEQMSCDIADNYFNKSLYYHRQAKGKIHYPNISVILYNKGNCFLSLNQVDSARYCYDKSYWYADQIEANSLKAFADKGLAEIKTTEHDYLSAVKLLLEAQKISGDVGDKVLNEGIYKGLADNYLLSGDLTGYERYNRKYEEIRQQTQLENSKTLNRFVVQIDTETAREIDQVKSRSLLYKIPLAVFVVASFLLLILEISRSRRKYNRLKTLRAELETGRDTKR
ncbi:MAG: hypothetical protein EOO48_11825 [Flavobacterium sp.]|nr:MAG: hypothetical protein EOO48_11825 [Flavobacterium sp.]